MAGIEGRAQVASADSMARATGEARYVGDLRLPGMVYAGIVRSDVAHGVIRHVDVRRAEAAPGVLRVLTGERHALQPDWHTGTWLGHEDGPRYKHQPILAVDRVRFVGEPVAAVVATSQRAVVEALRLIELEIEPLPVVNGVEEALRPDAPALHAAPAVARVNGREVATSPAVPNLCYAATYEKGDIRAGRDAAVWVHEARYTLPPVSHYAMEPHVCLARATTDGTVEIWSGTQEPWIVRADVARILGVGGDAVRVHVPPMGGAYGGKNGTKYEPLAALLSTLVDAPVRIVIGLEDSFRTVSRHGAVIDCTTGVDDQGSMVFREITAWLDAGAYAEKAPVVANKAAYRAAGPYPVPHVKSTALAVFTNHVPAGAFRGFGTPQVAWAAESAIDEVAAHLGIDPLEYRERSLARRGQVYFDSDKPLDSDLALGVRRAADEIGWADARPHLVGRGVATGVKDGGGGVGRSEASLSLHSCGKVVVEADAADIGQGVHEAMRTIVARELSCGREAVAMALPDTGRNLVDLGTISSRSTVAVGRAVQTAARLLRQALLDAVGSPSDRAGLALDGADIVIQGHHTPLREVLPQLARGGLDGPWPAPCESGCDEDCSVVGIIGAHENVARSDTLLGVEPLFYEVGHGAAEVEVDEHTGQVRVRKYVSVVDVGYAIDESACVGQDEGAVMMGLGHALYESLEYDDGVLTNGTPLRYRVPLAGDVPPHAFHSVLVENGDGPGPYGSKGVGQTGVVPVGPAIANAVYQATGARVRDLPLTPERVWRAMREVRG